MDFKPQQQLPTVSAQSLTDVTGLSSLPASRPSSYTLVPEHTAGDIEAHNPEPFFHNLQQRHRKRSLSAHTSAALAIPQEPSQCCYKGNNVMGALAELNRRQHVEEQH